MASVRIGVSGWRYPHWRGRFYPRGLPQRRELEHVATRFPTVELDGSFYSLQRPASYLAWRDATPPGFVFAVKGGRFITHMKRLRDARTPLANVFASGVLALGDRLGPLLWQLPERQRCDLDVLEQFLDLLPASTRAAARLAEEHDDKLRTAAWTDVDADRPVRHALEARHRSFEDPAALRLLREHGVALVVSEGAGRWPLLDHVTAPLVYVRLHGRTRLYASGYAPRTLDEWAGRVRAWYDDGRDVVVYLDNDGDAHAPCDALALTARLADVAVPAAAG
ncbi:DUF72 domain-containing protein [Xylanimonas protaetiae]|uniref:DUF72 domain-containing protein n=1 Tax=Xylanimonas protaetiae TaxID=2509457 RepID=A0A4V0YG64_9MICO|nr:DUF72 domain-containing protein [Xylanimonas protaetiae]QAY70121.1 DUF72 domain-containing protein [Xylanimonas protaetiae]